MNSISRRLKNSMPPALSQYISRWRRKILRNPLRISLQKQKLLKSALLEPNQIELLNKVNNTIHHNDGMYSGNVEHYFLVGLAAIRCIDEVLEQVPSASIRNILDLPSGYGRELRFLICRFPQSAITACDLLPEGVDFCAATFGSAAVYSQVELSEVSFANKFDLIWCGSLVTHLDDSSTMELLDLFSRYLNPGGIVIFTTHGDYVFNRMNNEHVTYGLPDECIPELTADYRETGYGYEDYEPQDRHSDSDEKERGYGISLMSPEWLRSQCKKLDGLEEIYFKERGWDNHQDVFAFIKSA